MQEKKVRRFLQVIADTGVRKFTFFSDDLILRILRYCIEYILERAIGSFGRNYCFIINNVIARIHRADIIFGIHSTRPALSKSGLIRHAEHPLVHMSS